MYRKNLYEYLDSQQNPEDIYPNYRKQQQKIRTYQTAQAAGEYLLNEAEAALKAEILKIFKEN